MTPPPPLTVVRPPISLPQAGVALTPQANTAIPPPLLLRSTPQAGFPYGALAGDSRPY
jgi:hypothetical protein